MLASMTAQTPFPLPRQLRESTLNVGDGTAGPYGPSTYHVWDTADVFVFARAEGEDSFADVTEACTITKTEDAPYDTFAVTFDAALPATTTWYSQARRTHERLTAATKGGAVSADELEKELSRQATVLSELRRDANRALRVDLEFDGSPQLPVLEDTQTFVWDAEAGRFVPGPTAADIDGAQGFAEAASAARDATEALRDATAALKSEAESAVSLLYNNWVPGPSGTSDGTLEELTLPHAPGSAWNVIVVVGGLVQTPEASYTVDGTTLSFSEAVPEGVPYNTRLGSAIDVGAPSTGSVGRSQMANDAVGADQLDAGEASAIRDKLGIVAPAAASLPGFFNGFRLANSGSHGITIGAGAAWAGDALLVLSAALTKAINSAWTAGSGNGGLDTGSVAAGTYHLWLIEKDSDGSVDALFSLSASAPTMPAGYTRKVYLWPVVRGASANWNFVHVGDFFQITDAPTAASMTSISTTAASVALPGIPTGVKVLATLIGNVFDSVGSNLIAYFSSPDAPNSAPNAGTMSSLTTAGSTRWVSGQFTLLTDTSAQIRVRGSAAISNASVLASGWRFLRG